MSEELKPCPFCGSSRVDGSFIRDGWRIGCLDCGAGVGAFHPAAHTRSAEKWNHRANNSDGNKVIVIGEETISALRQGMEVGITNGMFLIPASDLAPSLSSTEGTEG